MRKSVNERLRVSVCMCMRARLCVREKGKNKKSKKEIFIGAKCVFQLLLLQKLRN